VRRDFRGAVLPSILLSGVVLAVVWGALAFGAVYPWAYTPLAIGGAVIGLAAFTIKLGNAFSLRPLTLGCLAIAAAISLQLMPLSPRVLGAVSPSTDRFLSRYDLSYQMSSRELAGDGVRAAARWPISLTPSATVLGLSLFLALAIFMLGTVRIVSGTGALAAARALVIFGVMLAVFAIGQYVLSGGETYLLKIYGFWQPQYRGSPFGPFVNRNHFAGWMLMVLPLAAAAAYGAAVSERHDGLHQVVSWLSRSPVAARMQLMTLAATVMGLSILLSQSRSGMLALAAEAALLGGFIVRRQASRRGRVIAVTVIAAGVLVVAAWAGLDRLMARAATVAGDLPTGGGRIGAWGDTVHIIRDFPVTGTGLNTFGTAMVLYQTGNRDLHFQEAHNDYLQLAAEGGLLVGIPVAILVWIFVRAVKQRFAEAPAEGSTYWLRIGAVIALLGIAVQAFVEFSLQMPGNAALFAVIAAIALHRSPNLRTHSRSAAPSAAPSSSLTD